MLFNSIEFGIFLSIVFFLYWFVVNKSLKLQNFFVLTASYTFYGWWDMRFLGLIIVSSLTDYIIGLKLDKSSRNSSRRYLLFTSLFINLGMLGVFKYFNFFIDSFVNAFSLLGISVNSPSLHLVLPVGISFYTFQTLSYTIDIYRKRLRPTEDIVAFFAFIGFFPQLVAGPIERASSLLPQFQKKRIFEIEKAKDGIRQTLWGLFKKVVIADNCSEVVNPIFADPGQMSGSTLFLGAIYFLIQIYCDFSGYSDMAIGVSRLFGFNLTRNFAYPFFAKSHSDFWQRWHISLTTWFRDYVYFSFKGQWSNKWFQLRNVLIIYTLIGFWHGPNWTFIIWGFINGLLFIPTIFFPSSQKTGITKEANPILPTLEEALSIVWLFVKSSVIAILFRAKDLSTALVYLKNMVQLDFFSKPNFLGCIPWVICLFSAEWLQRDKQHALEIGHLPKYVRELIYFGLAYSILLFGSFAETEFFYFQF